MGVTAPQNVGPHIGVEKEQSVGSDEGKRHFLRHCAILVEISTIDQSVRQVSIFLLLDLPGRYVRLNGPGKSGDVGELCNVSLACLRRPKIQPHVGIAPTEN
ncbi:hypothetical protein [Paraburkholderia fungorum]|uniref:hypothetical protein n=1 Tax=Paraburkholderia fungorum TaxID=134537 RepID=UPI0038B92323